MNKLRINLFLFYLFFVVVVVSTERRAMFNVELKLFLCAVSSAIFILLNFERGSK